MARDSAPENCQANIDEEIDSAASNGIDTDGRHYSGGFVSKVCSAASACAGHGVTYARW